MNCKECNKLKQKEQQCERLQTAWQSLKDEYIKLEQENEILRKNNADLIQSVEPAIENESTLYLAGLSVNDILLLQKQVEELKYKLSTKYKTGLLNKLYSEKQMLVEVLEKIASGNCEDIKICPIKNRTSEKCLKCIENVATKILAKLKGE